MSLVYTEKEEGWGGCSCWKPHYLCSAAMRSAEKSCVLHLWYIFYIFSWWWSLVGSFLYRRRKSPCALHTELWCIYCVDGYAGRTLCLVCNVCIYIGYSGRNLMHTCACVKVYTCVRILYKCILLQADLAFMMLMGTTAPPPGCAKYVKQRRHQ